MLTLENILSSPGVRVLDGEANPTRTITSVIEVSRETLESLLTPHSQRELKTSNRNVKSQVKEIQQTGIIPGTILIGIVNGKAYKYDGQHRIWAALETDLDLFVTRIQVTEFASQAELGMATMKANAPLVRRTPDDNLKTMEDTYPVLKKIMKECPFLGYSKRTTTVVMSANLALQCWDYSKRRAPSNRGGTPVDKVIEKMSTDEAKKIIDTFHMLHEAWGADKQYKSMWSKLNVTLVLWLWRALVDDPKSTGRSTRLTKAQFRDAIMGLSADSTYLSWIYGRLLRDDDRTPCYNRIKIIIVKRLREMHDISAILPTPPGSSK